MATKGPKTGNWVVSGVITASYKSNCFAVSCGGWFAFCWESGGNEKIEVGEGSNQPVQSPLALKVSRLHAHISTDLLEAVSIVFPVEHHATHVGKLFFLPAGVNVDVVLTTGLSEWTTVRWKLLRVRSLADPSTVPSLGAWCTDLPKTYACMTCARTFASPKSANLHFTQIHDDPNKDWPSPLWSTPLIVYYRDDCLAVIFKPHGMPVMGEKRSLIGSPLLLSLRLVANNRDTLGKPRPVHRLDAATAGLLVVALTRTAERRLKDMFASREHCRKRYRSLVWGHIGDDKGSCDSEIAGKPALSRFQVVKRIGVNACLTMTLVDLYLETGRTYQLRKHMQQMGHPIVGDSRYQGIPAKFSSTRICERLCLWAVEISIPHPLRPDTSVECCLAEKEIEWMYSVMKMAEETAQV